LKRNINLGARRTVFRNASQLRQSMTIPEQMLWERLKGKQVLGIRFRRQHAVRRYILDFYAHEIKLGIELDGTHHKENSTSFYDDDRTEILTSWGITIIRFDNEEVRMNLDGVIESIESKIRLLRSI
jgi:very-short-patch-repair endonuclease